MRIKLEFKLEDCWIGVFWRKTYLSPIKYRRRWVWHVWICLVPMLPIHISWEGKE